MGKSTDKRVSGIRQISFSVTSLSDLDAIVNEKLDYLEHAGNEILDIHPFARGEEFCASIIFRPEERDDCLVATSATRPNAR